MRQLPAVVAIALLASACTTQPEPGSATGGLVAKRTGSEPRCGTLDWCHVASGRLPDWVESLQLPELNQGGRCPTTHGRRYANRQFGGIVLGSGPVRPLIAPNRKSDAGAATRGILRFRRSPERPGLHSVKTLWFAEPRYRGPVLIRGRQLDGSHKVRFGEVPSLVDPFLPAGPTMNGANGFREWPGATWLVAPGCYAWQIDGRGFSYMIVFEAVLPGVERS